MNTTTLAAAVIGFLLGGLTVSVAAVLEDGSPEQPTHRTSQHEASADCLARCLWKIP
jgi:hypothetical protein